MKHLDCFNFDQKKSGMMQTTKQTKAVKRNNNNACVMTTAQSIRVKLKPEAILKNTF